jgi:hypothetical protein
MAGVGTPVRHPMVDCPRPMSRSPRGATLAPLWRPPPPRRGAGARPLQVLAAVAAVLGAACGPGVAPTPARPAAPGLPPPGALTLAGEAGQVLVGLTLEPGTPGTNTVSVYLSPIQGAQAAASLRATVSEGGTTRALQSCGSACRRASLALQPGAELDVDVQGPLGGRASFTVPHLPAPSGQSLLAQAQTRMHRLRSYADHNTLFGGAGPTIVTDSVNQAPDRARWTVDGNQTIWIGTTQYTQAGPDQPWTETSGLAQATYPFFVWDPFTPLLDAHVVGSAVVDGTATTEVAFFGTDPGYPVWFEIWVASGGLILRSSMLAQAHFMHDTYSAFDQPASIVAPATFTVAVPAAGGAPSGSAQGSFPTPTPQAGSPSP